MDPSLTAWDDIHRLNKRRRLNHVPRLSPLRVKEGEQFLNIDPY